jgi:tyrosyl-tRNA synthetase
LLSFVSNTKLSTAEDIDIMMPRKTSSVYIGFDPTAESIHLGNYIGLLTLNYFRLAGK